jgi:hypothetical protein
LNRQRLQYLEAIGVELWLPRGRQGLAAPAELAVTAAAQQPAAAAAAPALHFAPGSGSCLFVCASAAESATPLASDLARTVGGAPVWAWPAEGADGQLEQVAEERLFTAVLIFGEALAHQLYGQQVPANCGPAPLLVAPALASVAASAQARRACWAAIRASGLHLGR